MEAAGVYGMLMVIRLRPSLVVLSVVSKLFGISISSMGGIGTAANMYVKIRVLKTSVFGKDITLTLRITTNNIQS